MSAASGSPSYRRARLRTIRWVLRYTRGLPWRVAEQRQAEIASDLWEQAAVADERGTRARALARSVRLRRIAGVRADLAWRAAVLQDAARVTAEASSAGASTPAAVAPATPVHLFDQTNGVLNAEDGAVDQPDHNGVLGLLGSALASNAVSSGSFGGGGN